MTPTDVDLWEDLLLAVEDGQVVPVVGRALLVVEGGEQPCVFHHLVAKQLASELKIPTAGLRDGFDIHDVVCAYEDFHGDPMAINPRVVRILKTLKVPVPEPLRLLAAIPQFRLFVSTTFDNLLEEALKVERERPPAVVAFPPASSLTDLDDALIERHGSLVFHVLGKASASSPFAVTEGQMLEQMHDLMVGPRRPERLLARLQESHLLILGVGFPDWLARFLLRLARTKPLWDSRAMMEVIADAGPSQQGLTEFLRHFSPQRSRVFAAGSAVDFVRELHRRWFERHPGHSRVEADQSPESTRPAAMAAGSIFVSYASEDREAAFKLADHLISAGLDVWVDRRINPGEDYRHIIEQHIRECAAFIPIISRHTQPDDERWFRKEWKLACERAGYSFATDRAFLFPVVVDSTPATKLNEMRRETFGRSAVWADAGVPPANLMVQLDKAQKAWRKQYAAV